MVWLLCPWWQDSKIAGRAYVPDLEVTSLTLCLPKERARQRLTLVANQFADLFASIGAVFDSTLVAEI